MQGRRKYVYICVSLQCRRSTRPYLPLSTFPRHHNLWAMAWYLLYMRTHSSIRSPCHHHLARGSSESRMRSCHPSIHCPGFCSRLPWSQRGPQRGPTLVHLPCFPVHTYTPSHSLFSSLYHSYRALITFLTSLNTMVAPPSSAAKPLCPRVPATPWSFSLVWYVSLLFPSFCLFVLLF